MLSSIFRTVRPAYEIPEDDLIGEILIPALSIAEDARIAAGFFTSRCLAQIAGGLAAFINESESTLDLMVSPEISDEDRDAIRTALREPQAVLTEALIRLFEGARISASAIERHTVHALAYLVASNRSSDADRPNGTWYVSQEDMAVEIRRRMACSSRIRQCH